MWGLSLPRRPAGDPVVSPPRRAAPLVAAAGGEWKRSGDHHGSALIDKKAVEQRGRQMSNRVRVHCLVPL